MAQAVEIAEARDDELPSILALFNHEIREGVALWNTQERSLEEMAAWAATRREAGMPVLSARSADGAWLGYGSYGPFRPHDGYAHSVEHSLYVAPHARGAGVGSALLESLETRARAAGLHVMIGGADAGNETSIRLHRRSGFQEVARIPEVGRKFGRWLTLVLMQKVLD